MFNKTFVMHLCHNLYAIFLISARRYAISFTALQTTMVIKKPETFFLKAHLIEIFWVSLLYFIDFNSLVSTKRRPFTLHRVE